jgi:hypothetical protein
VFIDPNCLNNKVLTKYKNYNLSALEGYDICSNLPHGIMGFANH